MTSLIRPYRLPLSSLCLLAVLLSVGCANDSTPASSDDPIPDVTPVNPAGNWTFHFVNTKANGVCASEANDISDEHVTITTTGSSPTYQVVVKGFIGSATNQLRGTFYSNHLTITGSYAEDGGTTTSTHNLIATSENSMVGTENWSWTGGGGTCTDGLATVTATRVN